MVSLKKLTKLLVFGIILFIVVAIGFNFYLLPTIKKFSDDNVYHMEILLSKSLSMELPLRGIDNVLSQSNVEFKNIPNIKLVEAFERYQISLYTLAEESIVAFDALHSNLERLNTLSLKRHNTQVDKMDTRIVSLRHSAQRIDKLTKGSKMDAMPFEIINDYGHELSSGLVELKQINKAINDGTGYPEGLVEKEIPLSARIVAVADVFDALTSKRTYKESFSFEASVEMIKEASGTHFDPVIVERFIENLDKVWNIYQEIDTF